jgi:tetratricopeptide (TPR) repeat protein
LVFDDLQWADESSLDFIEHLVSSCRGAPVMVLCLTRPEFFEQGHKRLSSAPRIQLAPLERQSGRQLVDALLARMRDVPQALRDLVTATAEGNPYFIEELIGVLIEDGVIGVDDSGWHVVPDRLSSVRVPTTLAGVLQARVDALPPRQRTTLQQASVVGHVFWDDALRRLGPTETRDLEEFVRRELTQDREPSIFQGTQEYSFKHHLLHAVTYQGVLREDKRRLHRAAAEWLISRSRERASEYHGLIADHYDRAGDTEKAIEYLRKAASDAWYSYALPSALAYFDRAIGSMPASHAKFEVMLERAGAAFDTRDTNIQERCIVALEDLAGQLNDDAKLAIAASFRATHEAGKQDLGETRDSALKALTFAERSGHIPSAIRAHNQWGFALVAAGDLVQAQHHAGEALSLARRTSNSVGQANALGLMGLIAEEEGDRARARPHREAAIQFYVRDSDRVWKRWAICRAATNDLALGDSELAVERLLTAYSELKAIGAEAHERDAAAQLAHAACLAERYEDVFEWAAKAGGLDGERAQVSLVPGLLMDCGDAYAALANLDEARKCYDRCVAMFESWNLPLGALDPRCGLARVYLARGDARQAAAHVADVVKRVGDGWKGARCFDPCQVLLTTYEVMRAIGDPQAHHILIVAHSLVVAQAAQLDPEQSANYLQSVKTIRKIRVYWEAGGA